MTRYRRTIVSRFLLHLLVCLTTIANAQNGVINGFVRNQATNESLAYVNIFIKDGLIGAITDRDGYYVLSGVPRDDLTLVASLIGYGMAEVQLNLTETRSVRHDFVLAPQSLKGQEITVTAERQRFREKVEVSAVTLDPRQIQVAPAFVEADIFRTIQYLPGVQSISDYSSALYVRGSTPDQNLILLDGITIYNPFHFGGVFSTFNTDAIKQADFIAGGFPANYGGRMGAVLEITNRDGNANEFAGKANISLISSKLLLEGPLPKMGPVKGTYMLSGRRTYFDALFNGIAYLAGATKDPNFVEFPYYFYDLNGKASLDMGTMHRVVLSHFVGDDVIHVDVDNSSIWEDDYSGVNAPIRSTYTSESYLDWRWGNRATSASWRWIITPKLVSRLYAAQSTFRYTVHLEESNTSRWVYADNPTDFNKSEFGFQLYDRVRDRTIRLGLTYLPNDRHTVLTGIERKYYDFGTGWDFWSHFEDPDTSLAMRDTILSISYEPFEEAAYIQDQWRLGSRFVLQPGVRFSRYSLHKGWNVEPRMSGKFFIQSNVALTGAWGEYYQYLTTANPSDEQLRLIDLWLPVPPDQPAPHSVHHIAGIEYLSDNNLLVKVEIYNKSLDNLLYLKHGAMLFLIPEDMAQPEEALNDFRPAKGKARGAELLIRKSSGDVRGWLGYTYSRTKWYNEQWGWFFPKYDRTHTLNLVADWQLNDRWHFSTAYSYSTGNPYTPIRARYQRWQDEHPPYAFRQDPFTGERNAGDAYWRENIYLVAPKNSARYPSYHRWDVGLVRRREIKQGRHKEFYIQIQNVLNHANVFQYIYSEAHDKETWESLGTKRITFPMFPFFPTIGVRYEF